MREHGAIAEAGTVNTWVLDPLPFLTSDEVDALLSPYARHDEREQMRRREQAVRTLSENRYALMDEINQWINGRGLLVRALVAVVFAVLKGYHLVRGLTASPQH
ncbi:hypothetical protein [Streptomyces sp. NPDC048272]|uniref:hypothetical protein n=1 Tax=Streptomyces sp. NPDC048272 TaxID=3154616 RepID=UPI00342C08E5